MSSATVKASPSYPPPSSTNVEVESPGVEGGVIMPSFEDMQKLYQNVGSHGQQLKAMADEVMQQTWDNDIATRQCYIYDYFHDDQPELKGGENYHPELSKTKIPVKLKFIIKEYKSASKDDPEYHIQFEPDVWNSMSCKPDWFIEGYEKLGIEFPIGLAI